MKLLIFAAVIVLIALLLRNWRSKHGSAPTGPSDPGMSVDEACSILGLDGEPTREEIIGAHRRLMQKVHPDHGGSTYLAQQLNEAKRVLLSTRSQ